MEDEQKNLRTHWGIEGWIEALEDGQRHWKTEKALEDGQRYWRMDRGIGDFEEWK